VRDNQQRKDPAHIAKVKIKVNYKDKKIDHELSSKQLCDLH